MSLLNKTPMTLADSIENGLVAILPFVADAPGTAHRIEPYVRDFICNRFTVAIIEHGDEVAPLLGAVLRSLKGERGTAPRGQGPSSPPGMQ